MPNSEPMSDERIAKIKELAPEIGALLRRLHPRTEGDAVLYQAIATLVEGYSPIILEVERLRGIEAELRGQLRNAEFMGRLTAMSQDERLEFVRRFNEYVPGRAEKAGKEEKTKEC